jgi:hypothetical protein
VTAGRPARRSAALAARLSAVLATVVASVASCSRQSAESTPQPPAVLDPAPGVTMPVVRLSEPAYKAVRVASELTQAAPGGVVIPTKAVIYSPDGAAWTYVALAPLAYVRQAIVIDRISGTEAFLSSGPAVGTPVVTIGAPELLGTEYGVGEE